MGLVIILALGLYLVFSMGVIAWVINYAKKNGKSATRWGCGAALVMYLLVFWDWIPTVVAHKYYCATEAGFWVYKTPEQWKKENPGVMEGFVVNKVAPLTREGVKGGFTDTYLLNQRINKIVKENRASSVLPIYRLEQEVVDAGNGNVLGRYVDFWTGYVDGLEYIKFWMTTNKHCSDGERNYGKFILIKRAFQGEEN